MGELEKWRFGLKFDIELKTKLMKFLKTKYITPIALLIFFMPFLRMCESNKSIKEIEHKKENVTEIITEKEGGLYVGNEINLNAYEIAYYPFRMIKEKDFELKFFRDKEFYAIILYSIVILFSILMIVFSWEKRYFLVRNLGIVNIILLTISTILFVKSKFIDEFADVKYGLYVFLIYSILIIYISNKENLEFKT